MELYKKEKPTKKYLETVYINELVVEWQDRIKDLDLVYSNEKVLLCGSGYRGYKKKNGLKHGPGI